MAVASQVVSRFAEVTGRLPNTIVRTLGTLRTAGLVPRGGPGGGKAAAHFGVSHLATVVLALAGPEPSDAASASSSLARLRSMAFTPTADDVRRHMLADRLSGPIEADWSFPFANLGEFVEHLIRTSMKIRSSSGWVAEAVTDDAWALELCLGPLSARVMRGTIVQMTFTASDEAGPPPGLRVVTVLTLPVILAAADLALDTEQHENQAALRPPTTKTAALRPCQGTDAAAPSQPPATERERSSATAPALPERETALNRYPAGFPFITRRGPHVRERHVSTHGAGR